MASRYVGLILPARRHCETVSITVTKMPPASSFWLIPLKLLQAPSPLGPAFELLYLPISFHLAVRAATTASTSSPRSNTRTSSYTYRFEQFVLRSLIGQRGGGRRPTPGDLGRDGGTDRGVSTGRGATDRSQACHHRHWPGSNLSLKKRHRLYVTLMTDLSDPARPQILAVASKARTRPRPRSVWISSRRSNTSRSGPTEWTWDRPIPRRAPCG